MMNSREKRQGGAARVALWCAVVGGFAATHGQAALTNRYTFNTGNANDSAGTAHGTIVDNTAISSFTGGALNLTGNNDLSSAQDFTNPATVGAFVNLPNGVFHDAVVGGNFGQVTIETWVTIQQNRTWTRVWDFGTSGPGEDISGDSGSAQYIFVSPQVGIQTNGAAGSTHNTGDTLALPAASVQGPLSINVRHHLVLVLDQNDTTGSPDGTARFYIDNLAPVASGINPGLFLDSMLDNNNWIGRSQWGDPLLDGLVDEFNIYSHALTPAEVAANFATGPAPVPLPTLRVNRGTGEITLVNPSTTPFNIKSFSIGSAAGGLNPAGFTSIDAGNAFDPDGTWTTSSLTVSSIAEAVTSGTLDGGVINGGTSKTIGAAWSRTPLSSDLTFSFALNGGTSGSGQIEYVGSAPIRSDLNGDGALTPADWSIFVTNAGKTFTGDLPVVAYLKGDLDANLTNDYVDFTLFKGDYIAANGPSAFAALSPIPEPATAALVVVALGGAVVVSRRRSA